MSRALEDRASPFPFAAAVVALWSAACDDALDQRLAIVDSPRVLAVIAEPAEARPGATVRYRAVFAGPDGPIAPSSGAVADAIATWAYCTTPKAPTEDNAVSAACVNGDALVPLASGADALSATGALPMDGCLRFGPDVPPGGFRPRDADPTGGFYQPVRVDTGGAAPLAFGMSRITCNLANATPEAFRQYALEYVANTNPVLESVALDGVLIDPASDPSKEPAPPGTRARVASDAEVTISVSWTPESVESYLYYDRERQRLVTRREAMRVSFFATGGELPVDSLAIAELTTESATATEPASESATARAPASALPADASPTTSASITWRSPAGNAGEAVFVWIVLRDARGGVAVKRADLVLE